MFAGGPITGDNTGVEVYGTIFAIAESPLKKDLLWVGSDDGLVHLSIDGGAEWRNVTPNDMPEWGTVRTLEPSQFDEGTAYLVAESIGRRHESVSGGPRTARPGNGRCGLRKPTSPSASSQNQETRHGDGCGVLEDSEEPP
jgi:hypothetical protein